MEEPNSERLRALRQGNRTAPATHLSLRQNHLDNLVIRLIGLGSWPLSNLPLLKPLR